MVRYETLLHLGIDLHNLAWRRGGRPPHHREVRLSLDVSWCWSEAWERSINCHDIVPVSATEEPVFNCSSLGPAEDTHCGAEGGFAYRNCSSSHAVGGGCPSSMLQGSIV